MIDPDLDSSLLVPIEVSALPVGVGGRSVAQVAHTFEIERNPDVLWLGENTEPAPFEPGSPLGAGVHLHWSLPRALTRGRVTFTLDDDAWPTLVAEGLVERGTGLRATLERSEVWSRTYETRAALEQALDVALDGPTARATGPRVAAEGAALAASIAATVPGRNAFPVVPNRWLVTRTVVTGPDRPAPRRWVVESDRLWDDDEDVGAVADPCRAQNDLSPTVPHLSGRPGGSFRYLGRTYEHDGWSETEADRHVPHTALGYGHVTFAAALPHCYNVFGLYDPLVDASAHRMRGPLTLEYSVVGWYARGAGPDGGDPELASPGSAATGADWVAGAGWWWPEPADDGSTDRAVPGRILLGRRLTNVPWDERRARAHPPAARGVPPIQVAVGANPSEALSALWSRQGALAEDAGAERYLNVLQAGLLNRLETRMPGFLREWDEALQRNDFTPVPGGTLWILEDRSSAPATNDGDASGAHPRAEVDARLRQAAQQSDLLLAGERGLDRLLADLNTAQQRCDGLAAELDALASELFADWCGYLQVRHPRPNRVQRSGLLLNPALRALRSAVDHRAEVAAARRKDVAQRNRAANAVAERLEEMRGRSGSSRLDFELVPQAAPHFWQPKDPVVLIAGEDARRPASTLPTHIDGSSTSVACQVRPTAGRRGSALAEDLEPNVSTQVWDEPWRPLLLQWEATLRPGGDDARRSDAAGDVAQELVAAGFDPHHDSELAFLPRPGADDATERYAGSVLLTEGADLNIVEQARTYLRDNPTDESEATGDLRALVDPDRTAPALLSQALSGFNASLLARRQSLQLPVVDPHETDPRYRELGAEVRKAIGPRNDLGTSEAAFNPLRRGHLHLTRLWLIDSFGQVVVVVGRDSGIDDFEHRNLASTDVIRAERFVDDATSDAVALRPRLVQPTRLLFRWRSAAPLADGRRKPEGDVEMNSHPATSPVVGWLVVNHLEGWLDVFDPAGVALGSFDGGGTWRGAPGPRSKASLAEAVRPDDPHLLALGTALGDATYATDLIDAISTMTTHVLPRRHDQYDGASILMGRPLALVRASVELQVQGPPAADPGWDAYRARLLGGGRDTSDVEHLQVPVRLGQKGHLDDGLIGLFTGPPGAATDYGTFLVEDHPPGEDVGVRAPRLDDLVVTSAAGPRMVTLLVDPRAPVHATTGILPVKEIDLPSPWVASALRRIAVTFPVAPTLQPLASDATAGDVPAAHLPLAAVPGFDWSFTSRPAPGEWSTGTVAPADDQADLSAIPPHIVDGWLRLAPAEGGAPSGTPDQEASP